MITVTIPPIVAAVAFANLLILLIGSILFVRWVVKTIGVLRAAEFGTLFDASARRIGEELDRATAETFNKIDEQRELVLKMTARAQGIADSLTPEAVKKVIEKRAEEIAWARIDSEQQQRFHLERRVKRLERLVYGMTGTSADLADAVKDGLTGQWDPNLRGRVESYCAQRGVRVGVPASKQAATALGGQPVP